jgi:hypothetical protein
MLNRGETIRAYFETAVTLASGAAVSTEFNMSGYTLGWVYLASGVTGLALGAQGAPVQAPGGGAGSFTTLVDRSNLYGIDVSCVLPTARLTDQFAVPMPPFWFGAGRIKLLLHDLSGSGIPQPSATLAVITMKS